MPIELHHKVWYVEQVVQPSGFRDECAIGCDEAGGLLGLACRL